MPKLPPGKAVVIYGRKTQSGYGVGYKVVTEGNWSSVPIIEAHAFLPIHERKLDISMDDVHTFRQGVRTKARVKVTATVQISAKSKAVMVAAENLLDKSDEEIDRIATNVIEGTIRGSFNDKGVDVVEQDLKGFQKGCIAMASVDLMSIGIEVIDLAIHEVR